MKKILAIVMLCASLGTFSVSAHAERWHHGGGHYVYHPGFGWIVPAIVGGAIVYEATRPPVVIQQQPTVVLQQPPAPAPAGFHYEAILDANCNCYKTVLIAN
jgi:hypothetical protein